MTEREVSGPRALIVTTARSRGSLAAARALSRGGWIVGVGTPDSRGMAAASRHTQHTHVVPRPRGEGAAFVAAVNDAVATAGYDLLFGGADDWAAALSCWRDRLVARVAHTDHAALQRVMDKRGIVDAAARHGLAAPRTIAATPEAVAAWQGPAVVKCRTHWFPGADHRLRIEATRVDRIDARYAAVDRVVAAGFEPVLQAPVTGTLEAVVGVMAHGRLHGRVQQRAGGLWPTPSGVSAHAVTTAVDEDLAGRLESLLGEFDWQGLVEAQFITDRQGVRHLIDCNPRFYGSMSLALAAGVNLPDLWGRCRLGQPSTEIGDARAGVTYQWLAGDLRRALHERRGGLLRDLRATLGRTWRADARSVLELSDLAPGVVPLRARLRRG